MAIVGSRQRSWLTHSAPLTPRLQGGRGSHFLHALPVTRENPSPAVGGGVAGRARNERQTAGVGALGGRHNLSLLRLKPRKPLTKRMLAITLKARIRVALHRSRAPQAMQPRAMSASSSLLRFCLALRRRPLGRRP